MKVSPAPPGAVAAAGGAAGAGGAGGSGGTVVTGGKGGQKPIEPQSCPAGEFATGFDKKGKLTCAAIEDGQAIKAVGTNCEAYYGWRDGCSDCTKRPKKWGTVSTLTCTNGRGEDNHCADVELGEETVPLFGLNTDGDVNDDDKFYISLQCAPLSESGHVGKCKPGEFLKNVDGDNTECVNADHMVVNYVRNNCSVFLGWRDNCDGCTADPEKWGRQQGVNCKDGAGESNICYTPFINEKWVPMFGVNTDGDVDDNDAFYLGMHCDDGAAGGEVSAQGPCPAGTLMIGIEADGSLRCASPHALVRDVVRSSCSLYGGWRDSCDGCAEPPQKWGRVGHGSCELGAGEDSGCSSLTLDGTSVEFLSLNTDGDVNDDDKFYLGWHCAGDFGSGGAGGGGGTGGAGGTGSGGAGGTGGTGSGGAGGSGTGGVGGAGGGGAGGNGSVSSVVSVGVGGAGGGGAGGNGSVSSVVSVGVGGAGGK